MVSELTIFQGVPSFQCEIGSKNNRPGLRAHRSRFSLLSGQMNAQLRSFDNFRVTNSTNVGHGEIERAADLFRGSKNCIVENPLHLCEKAGYLAAEHLFQIRGAMRPYCAARDGSAVLENKVVKPPPESLGMIFLFRLLRDIHQRNNMKIPVTDMSGKSENGSSGIPS